MTPPGILRDVANNDVPTVLDGAFERPYLMLQMSNVKGQNDRIQLFVVWFVNFRDWQMQADFQKL